MGLVKSKDSQVVYEYQYWDHGIDQALIVLLLEYSQEVYEYQYWSHDPCKDSQDVYEYQYCSHDQALTVRIHKMFMNTSTVAMTWL